MARVENPDLKRQEDKAIVTEHIATLPQTYEVKQIPSNPHAHGSGPSTCNIRIIDRTSDITQPAARLLTTVGCLVGVALVFWGASLSGFVCYRTQVTFLEGWILFVFVFISSVVLSVVATSCALSLQCLRPPSGGKEMNRVSPFASEDELEMGAAASDPTSLASLLNLTAQILLGVAGFVIIVCYLIYGVVQPGSKAAGDG
ncbi:uncharacterized protein LOC122255669 [Penaeus japonicus]|uniref:uncharacterized protein LOC122255669 n=1 Tax=Penaeus japonicus TaxID=27405 RepID=UPI001C713283|nr:uncharacterized protein LOC122255669 [Penaeus japonicus]